jgi:hypothetical protein
MFPGLASAFGFVSRIFPPDIAYTLSFEKLDASI